MNASNTVVSASFSNVTFVSRMSYRGYPNGQYVIITQPNVQYICIGDVHIYSAPGDPDIAPSASLTASSYYNDVNIGNINHLVDNTSTTLFCTAGAGGNRFAAANQWIQFDFHYQRPIYNIRIVNRPDGSIYQACGIFVSILDTNRNVIYTSNFFPSPTGYAYYNMYPPNASVLSTNA